MRRNLVRRFDSQYNFFMKNKFNELLKSLQEIQDLNAACSVLTWDQATYLPPKGAEARGLQLALLRKLSHEKATASKLGVLLDQFSGYEKSLSYDSFEASLLRKARKDFERRIKVPSQFISEFSNHTSQTYEAWIQAREKNQFSHVVPYLEKTLDLSRQYADFFPGYTHIANPIIDECDEGMSVENLKQLFSELREQLVSLVDVILQKDQVDETLLHKKYDIQKQKSFGKKIIKDLGYDFTRGRQDLTHHPFMIRFSLGDVRITTRYKEHDLTEGLFSTIHEAGHALYEQGGNWEFERTPLAGGVSAGIHESQSRLWENIVGRSREFWEFYYPSLVKTFPEQLQNVDLETFYRCINKVQNSLIRTDADEVTYNLHVMIRFDLECDLLEGKLAVKDLRDAWNARYEQDLKVLPPDDKHGVLQDVHWYADFVGGQFQGYTIGNILSAQFFEAASKVHPQIKSDIKKGDFQKLHGWLKENLYQYASQFTPEETIQKATGTQMRIEPYLKYLKEKYQEV